MVLNNGENKRWGGDFSSILPANILKEFKEIISLLLFVSV